MLECRDLSVGYHHTLVEHIQINLSEPGVYLLYGCNGCGKTTFFKTLAGLITPLKGEVLIQQKPLSQMDPLSKSKQISFCFNQIPMADITLQELMSFTIEALDMDSNNYVQNTLKALQLDEIKHSSLFQLSDGQRQKALIARALVQQTPLVLLDEPTAFLDYTHKINLIQFLLNFTATENKIVLINSHDPEWLQYDVKGVFGINQQQLMSFQKPHWTDITEKIYHVSSRL